MSLLLGAAIFMAVTWTRLGVGAQTALLLLVTALAATGAHLAVRARLRGAAESAALVAAGLAGLDAFGARAAGWLGADPDPGLVTALVGAAFAVVPALLLLLQRRAGSVERPRPPLPPLVTSQVMLGLGTVLAAFGLAIAAGGARSRAGADDVAVLTAALWVLALAVPVLTLLGRTLRARLVVTAVVLVAGAAPASASLLTEALVALVDDGDWYPGIAARLLLAALGWALLVPHASTRSTSAGTGQLREWGRAASSLVALALGVLGLVGPALTARPETTVLVATVVALVLTVLAALAPSPARDPWRRAGRGLGLGVGGGAALVLAGLVALPAVWFTSLPSPWESSALVSLDPTTDGRGADLPDLAWLVAALLLVPLVLVPVLVRLALPRRPERATPRALRPTGWVLAVTGTAWLLLLGTDLVVVVVAWALLGVVLAVRLPADPARVLPATGAAVVCAGVGVGLGSPSAGASLVALVALALVTVLLLPGDALAAALGVTRAGLRGTLLAALLLEAVVGTQALARVVAPLPERTAAEGRAGDALLVAPGVLGAGLVVVGVAAVLRNLPVPLVVSAAAVPALTGAALGTALDGRADPLVGALLAAAAAAVVGGAGTALDASAPPPVGQRGAASVVVLLAALVTLANLLVGLVDLLGQEWLSRPATEEVGGFATAAARATAPVPLVAAALALLPWLPLLRASGPLGERARTGTRRALAWGALVLGAGALLGGGVPRWLPVLLLAVLAAGLLLALPLRRVTPLSGAMAGGLAVLATLGALPSHGLAAVTLVLLAAAALAAGLLATRTAPAAGTLLPGVLAAGAWAAAATAVPVLVTLPGGPGLRVSGPVLLLGAALLVVVAAVRRREPVPFLEVVVAASVPVGTLMTVSVVAEPRAALALQLVAGGAVVAGHAAAQPTRRWAGWVASALVTAGTWLLLHRSGVRTPEAYTLPLAAGLLLHGAWLLLRDPAVSTRRALTAGLWLALLPSLWLSLREPLSTRALLLGLACLALVLVGVRLRLSQPVLAGAVVGLVLLGREATPWLTAGPRWVPFVLAGLVLGAVALTWEARLADVRRAAAYVGRLR
ncbi:SCO7613 C-terminal domain-containing membrane protein [Nocardioides bruguierae]|uniref:Uncharacterized protein n=1 Tax=Nocardioides bruguierae TaxID=2945102 RepID=A0A9X2D8D4_9ACTN|nr:hypothetical protein [Nocardioides bruguierae]MCM0620929.1 hypothetical protein [Nocardioides bruguierae]